MSEIKIAASILSADKDKLQKEVDEIQQHVDWIHVDIMDGEFVPPITFKPEEIKVIKTKLPKDVHLMVNHPLDRFIDDYTDADAYTITIHEECKDDVDKCIDYIKNKNLKVGIGIRPSTPVERLMPYIDKVDMILIMSVNPGYAGQKFIPEILSKITTLRKLKPSLDIQIDGGLNKDTIKQAVDAGANIIVAGSAIFDKEDRVKAIEELRDAVK